MNSVEVWNPIPGYEGFYEVSNIGRVKSVDRVLTRKNGYKIKVNERIISQRGHPSGYLMVSLAKYGTYEHLLVHRLVAIAFIGECPEGKEVAHGDGVKTNNHLRNLRYATRKENGADRILHGTSNKGMRNPVSKLTDSDILKIRTDNRVQQIIAKEYGVSQTLISQIKRFVIWSHVKSVSV